MDDDEEEENPLDKLTRELGEFRAEYAECTNKFSLNFDSHLGFINENIKSIARLDEKVDKNKEETDHDIKELKEKLKKKIKKQKIKTIEKFVEITAMIMDRPTFDQMYQYVEEQKPDLSIYTLLADFNACMELVNKLKEEIENGGGSITGGGGGEGGREPETQ